MSISQATLTDGTVVRAIGGTIVRSGLWEYHYFFREDGPQTFRFTFFPNNNIPVKLLLVGPGNAGAPGSSGDGGSGGNGGAGGPGGEVFLYNYTTGTFGTTVTWTASGGKGQDFSEGTNTVFTSTLSSWSINPGQGAGGGGGGEGGYGGENPDPAGQPGETAPSLGTYAGEPFFKYFGAPGSGGGGGGVPPDGGAYGGQSSNGLGAGGGAGAYPYAAENGQSGNSIASGIFGAGGGGGGGGARDGIHQAGADGGSGGDGVVIIAFKYRGN